MRRSLVLICALACGVAALSASAATRAAAPPGATARCRDGTYSSSAHHAGTCSHHGGVAAWLDGSAAAPGRPAGTARSSARLTLGRTVYLGRRTRTARCSLGALPDRRCSPGAIYSRLTRAVLCSSSFHTGSVRAVSDATRHAVEIEYGLTPRSYGRTLEIDHIVPLELGGSNDVANLYPEEASLPGGAPGYRVKDRLENRAHRLVCSGTMTLGVAQRAIASDWETFYERVFGGSAG